MCASGNGQITDLRTINGKMFACSMSGLSSDLKDCGIQPDWYAYIFVGSILKMTPAPEDEQEIQIVPEEVFSGSPPAPVTVITSQGLCMGPMAVGEHWLFYLHKEPGKPLQLGYGGASLPVAEAQQEIETFRRLKTIGNYGLLRGRVLGGERLGDGKPIENAEVFADQENGGRRFVATSGRDGYYEFPPLMPGEYKIVVGPVTARQPDNSSIEIKRSECWDLTLTRSPHALISGHIRFNSGKPAAGIGVVLILADHSVYQVVTTDADGAYTYDDLSPNSYFIGVNYPARTDWFEGSGGGVGMELPPASLFYPRAANIESAEVIQLKDDEKRDQIDFLLAAQ